MIYINTDLTGNTFSIYIKDLPKGGSSFLMVLYNDLIKSEKRFIINDISSANKNIFTIEITNQPTGEDTTIPRLYLNNWNGYNKYKIYFRNGIVVSYHMPESDLISEGYMYIYNNRTCYIPVSGSTELSYDYTYNCPSGSTDTGQTYITGSTESEGVGVPTGITGLSLWLRPEEISGITDGGDIVNWNDVSGRVKNCITTWDKPTHSANFINSLSAVKFSGTTDNPQFFQITDMGLTNGDDLTIFIVHKSVLSIDTTFIMAQYDCYGGFICGANPDDNGGLRYKGHQNVSDTGAKTVDAYLDNTWKLSTMIYDSNTDVYINGSASGEYVGSSVLEDNYQKWFIGMGIPYSDYLYENTFYEGWMSEILVYNKKLSTAEQLEITTYLNDKFGL